MTFCFVLSYITALLEDFFFFFNERYYIMSALNLSRRKREGERERDWFCRRDREEKTAEAESLNGQEVTECRSQVKVTSEGLASQRSREHSSPVKGDHTCRLGGRKVRWYSYDCLDFSQGHRKRDQELKMRMKGGAVFEIWGEQISCESVVPENEKMIFLKKYIRIGRMFWRFTRNQ